MLEEVDGSDFKTSGEATASAREEIVVDGAQSSASSSALCVSCKVRSNEDSRDKLCRVCRVDSHTRKRLWTGMFK
jgi:hypothetical protein